MKGVSFHKILSMYKLRIYIYMSINLVGNSVLQTVSIRLLFVKRVALWGGLPCLTMVIMLLEFNIYV